MALSDPVGGCCETALMTDISERYRRLAGEIATKVEQVDNPAWANPSPCEGWTAIDVLRHLVETQGMFAGLVGLAFEPGPDVTNDPGGAWKSASAQMHRLLADAQTAAKEFEGHSGTSTLATAVDRYVCFDLAIHGWDLARATGLDERIDPTEMPRLWTTAESFGDMIRSQGTCGPALEPPPDADEQDRLLAYLGRLTGPRAVD